MQGSDGPVSSPELAPEVDLVSIIDSVVGAAEDMRPLRLECVDLLRRHRAGTLTGRERQRYCTARLALLLRESANSRVRLPRSSDEVFARRSELLVEAILGPDVQLA
jgi:hypothetical protein